MRVSNSSVVEKYDDTAYLHEESLPGRKYPRVMRKQRLSVAGRRLMSIFFSRYKAGRFVSAWSAGREGKDMLYRFRNIKNLLENEELEEQYFYLADASQQNDPMEGYVDFYWQGDRIAWLGLFKNYAWGIYWNISHYWFQGTDIEDEISDDKYLRISESSQPDKVLLRRRQLEEYIVSDSEINKLATAFAQANAKLTEVEIEMLLWMITMRTVRHVNSILTYDNLGCPMYGELSIPPIPQEVYDGILRDHSNRKGAATFLNGFIDGEFLNSQGTLDSADLPEENRKAAKFLNRLYQNFPSVFISQIQKMVFSDCYLVCFNKAVPNPAMWAHYADDHKGVCLIFKVPEGNEPHLALSFPPSGGDKKMKFEIHPVQYGKKALRLNFFTALSRCRLPAANIYRWLKDGEEESGILRDMLDHLDFNRTEYRENSTERILRKSRSWQDEQEYRIVINDYMGVIRKPEDQRLYYDFHDLSGIIFGLKTPNTKKTQIIKIIQKKCQKEGQTDFHFYQAVYDSARDDMRTEEIFIPKSVLCL